MRGRDRNNYILILPSIFTTGNLFCGFYAILRSVSGDFEQAAYAIIVAGFFDVLDGRVARITRTQSKFGVEYDSISDVVSFGLAPAILCYLWVLQPFGRLGWAGSFFFAACGALRLARFNTISEELPKSYFLGLPIPAAANMVSATYLAYQSQNFIYPSWVVLFLTFFLGIMMVSSVRYRSFKDFDLRHRRSFVYMVMVVMILTALAWKHELALGVLVGGYVAWGPLREALSFLRKIPEKRVSQKTRQSAGGES